MGGAEETATKLITPAQNGPVLGGNVRVRYVWPTEFIGGNLADATVILTCYLETEISFGEYQGYCNFDFSKLTFAPIGKIDLSHANLGRCSFESHDLPALRDRFRFHNAHWNRVGRGLRYRVLLDENSEECERLRRGEGGPAEKRSHLSQEYGKFEKLYAEQGNHSHAGLFHYSKMDMWRRALAVRSRVLRPFSSEYRRWKKQRLGSRIADAAGVPQAEASTLRARRGFRHFANWVVLTLFWIASGYGDRWLRALVWLLVLLMTMSSIFLLHGFSYGSWIPDANFQIADRLNSVGNGKLAILHVHYGLSLSQAGIATLGTKEFLSNCLEALKYSLSHLAFRPSEGIRLDSLASKCASIAGMVLGPVQLALFLLAVRRKFRSVGD